MIYTLITLFALAIICYGIICREPYPLLAGPVIMLGLNIFKIGFGLVTGTFVWTPVIFALIWAVLTYVYWRMFVNLRKEQSSSL